MIVPHYRNRFFAGLVEAFESLSRQRGLCPVVVSTHRKSETERETAETLVAHQVEFLFVAGVQDPLEINRLCASSDIRSINIDLPGKEAPSAISDNRSAARALTERILQGFETGKDIDFRFFGGNASDNATLERIEGVREAFGARGAIVSDDVFVPCGYNPLEIADSIHANLLTNGKKAPAAVFANGITALEGLLVLRNKRGLDLLSDSVFGCYDWDPFAANLPHDISFVRQDVDGLIAAGFNLLDSFKNGENPTVRVPAELRPSEASRFRSDPDKLIN